MPSKKRISDYLDTSLLTRWIGGMSICLIVVGFVYIAVQQQYRSDANDPQIQIAEDTVASLAKGASPQSLVSKLHH